MRCLYVEDSADNHFLIGFYLKSLPIELVCVETTDAALSTLANELFDIILLDWNLPGSITALELLHEIDKDERYSSTKIWVISAMQSIDILPKIKPFSQVGFFRKPIRKNEFLSVLTTAFPQLA